MNKEVRDLRSNLQNAIDHNMISKGTLLAEDEDYHNTDPD